MNKSISFLGFVGTSGAEREGELTCYYFPVTSPKLVFFFKKHLLTQCKKSFLS